MLQIGSKIDFKRPGSGRGRPSVGTVKSLGLFVTVEDRLGETRRIPQKWVLGQHSGKYVRRVEA